MTPGSTAPTGRILIAGIGDGGIEALKLIRSETGASPDVCFAAVNTHRRSLEESGLDSTLLIGPETGGGAGGFPVVGQRAAETSLKGIKALLAGCRRVILIGGLGGGTATGALPVLAKAARGAGAQTAGVITLPFSFEGSQRGRAALTGISDLLPTVDRLAVIRADSLLDDLQETPQPEACFAALDRAVLEEVRHLIEH